jgi:hypothetical protein
MLVERRSMTMRPSAIALALGAVLVMGLGGYLALRPTPLSAEDVRYLDRSLAELDGVAPSLSAWLHRVFYVMGGYMFATGIVTLYVAVTAFRRRARGAATIVALAGSASVGGMALVELLIFRWALVVVALVWLLALALYQIEGLGAADLDRASSRPAWNPSTSRPGTLSRSAPPSIGSRQIPSAS